MRNELRSTWAGHENLKADDFAYCKLHNMSWSSVLRRFGMFYITNNIKIKNNFTSCIRERGSSCHRPQKLTLMVTEDEELTRKMRHKTQETMEYTEMCLTRYLITCINFKVTLTSSEDKFGGPAAPPKRPNCSLTALRVGISFPRTRGNVVWYIRGFPWHNSP
jgi:hypothetical protein